VTLSSLPHHCSSRFFISVHLTKSTIWVPRFRLKQAFCRTLRSFPSLVCSSHLRGSLQPLTSFSLRTSFLITGEKEPYSYVTDRFADSSFFPLFFVSSTMNIFLLFPPDLPFAEPRYSAGRPTSSFEEIDLRSLRIWFSVSGWLFPSTRLLTSPAEVWVRRPTSPVVQSVYYAAGSTALEHSEMGLLSPFFFPFFP